MARKKKTVENVLVTGIADRGKAVGRSETGQVLFVDGAVPGDVVDVLVLRKKKSFGQGVVKQFRSYSEDRVEPFCQHFSECGGCKWQHLDYDAQCRHKTQTVIDAMTRLAKLDPEIIEPIKASKDIKYYRNKLEYTFSNKRWLTKEEIETSGEIERLPALGFHRPGAWDKIVDIDNCYLQNDLSDKIRNFVRKYAMENELSFYNPREHEGFMRNLIVRNTTEGDWMVIVSVSKPDEEKIDKLMKAIHEEFDFISSLWYVANQKKNDTILDQDIKLYHGKDHIVEKLGEVKYKIGPKSFFQTNSYQAKVLFDTVVEYADLNGTENVYDLYTGLGSIALYVAGSAKHVVGIEEVEPAIEDAKVNAAFNGIENTTFYAGDVKDILTEEFITDHGTPDLIITDPPRAGMHADVVNTLLASDAPRIVYVSCNPATQARDLSLLGEKYEVKKMTPVDMFPHTHHIENVALLELRK